MKYLLVFIIPVLILVTSCGSFSSSAKHNQFGKEERFVKYYNEKLNLKSLTFGDFKFASSDREFKNLNDGKQPQFKKILLYAKTENPSYEYYILENQKQFNADGFSMKGTFINSKYYVLMISKDAPAQDKITINDNFVSLQD